MNEVSDFNKYKKAKTVVEELDMVLKIINLTIKGLKPFREYNSLSETLEALKDSKTILGIHFEHNKQVLKNKGQVSNET